MDMRIELSKVSSICASYAAAHILEKGIFEARANELMQFVDSFGTNHTIETGMFPVMTLNLPHDVNDDKYPYSEDMVEPVS